MSRIKNTGDHQIVRHFSTPAWFRNRPDSTIPTVSAGVYVVWKGDQLICAGMSGKNIEKQQLREKYGLVPRLESHAKGRLSGRVKLIYTVIYYLSNKIIGICLYSSRFLFALSLFLQKKYFAINIIA